MAKPIFIIELPNAFIASAPQHFVDNLMAKLKKEMNDYHILAFGTSVNNIQFKAFYDKDFEPVNLDELKEYIKKQLTK